ncbi:unnamed protein product [Lasius platythorax]|uniref:Uncharacterized protein n=1 Tax=Lasius platythorax TaxID=488582 RepID=A0AAV2NHJ5_9HYME
MRTLVASSILGLFWEEKTRISEVAGTIYRCSLRAKRSPGEPCGDKGIVSYVVDSGQAVCGDAGKREERFWRALSKSNTAAGRSRLVVSFRFMNGKSAGALERAQGAGECPTCESRIW